MQMRGKVRPEGTMRGLEPAVSTRPEAAVMRVRHVRSERDGLEALPAGHAVSWAALWAGEMVPRFPGPAPMGTAEAAGRHAGGEAV